MDLTAENDIFFVKDKLWKKEPNGDLLVDLLSNDIPSIWIEQAISNSKHSFLDEKFEPMKSNQVSTGFRVNGNQKFKEHKWRAAMEYYNQSLRFAVKDSGNASLAYANRSACFLHMRKYTQCLNDIEMARANGYPERLMHKLDEREALCLEKIQKGDEIEDYIEPKLSFDPDGKFLCMANVLEIKCNKEFGRHLVAKCDIDVGQTVLVEEAFASAFSAIDRTLCDTCMLPVKNFIPCRNCTDAMFCGELCMNTNKVHEISCGAGYNRLPRLKFVAKSVLIALIAFDTVEELMKFVEKQMTTSQFMFENEYNGVQTQYAMFLKLNEDQMKMDMDNIAEQHFIYGLLMTMPTIKTHFNSLKKQRFLMHLIWKHRLITDNRIAYAWCDSSQKEIFGKVQLLGNIQSLFNHSCAPNLAISLCGNKQLFNTVTPIKKGQQLFIMYNRELMQKSYEERQEFLRTAFNFSCKCGWCVAKNRPEDSIKMQRSRVFQLITEMKQRFDGMSNAERLILREKCFEFMRKFGHFPVSEEICSIIAILMSCLVRDYPNHMEISF